MVCQGESQTRFTLAAGPSSGENLATWPPPVSQYISILSLAMRWAERTRGRVRRMETFCFFIFGFGLSASSKCGAHEDCTVFGVLAWRAREGVGGGRRFARARVLGRYDGSREAARAMARREAFFLCGWSRSL